jgi:hypothetical protein
VNCVAHFEHQVICWAGSQHLKATRVEYQEIGVLDKMERAVVRYVSLRERDIRTPMALELLGIISLCLRWHMYYIQRNTHRRPIEVVRHHRSVFLNADHICAVGATLLRQRRDDARRLLLAYDTVNNRKQRKKIFGRHC